MSAQDECVGQFKQWLTDNGVELHGVQIEGSTGIPQQLSHPAS